MGNSADTIRDYGTIVHKHKLVLEITQGDFPTNRPPRWLALYGYLQFSREKKLVAPLIAAPDGERGKLYVTVLNSYISNYGYLFGTATYVGYLTFSHLNPITNPTPPAERNPNYRGNCTQP